MDGNSDIGRVEGLVIGIKEAFADHRQEMRSDLKEVKQEVSDILKTCYHHRAEMAAAMQEETRKRISADRAIEAKIPPPSNIDAKVEVNTTWRNRAIGGFFVLGGLAGWAAFIWRALK